MDQEPEAPPRAAAWTRVDDYLLSLSRQRAGRKARTLRPRTQVSEPRLILSTLPFLGLIGALAILMVAIALAAIPSARSPGEDATAPEQATPGRAAPGWYEAAKREMR